MDSRQKTALVTGGAGFIGSHLCEKLLKKGYRVVCVDNLLTGSRKNITSLVTHKNFSFIEHDIVTKIPNTKYSIPDTDYVYHLASPASPIHYQRRPLETLHVNSIGTENMLRLAHETGARILYVSTSEVYGDPREHPQKETYWGNVNPFGPRSCYDEGKRYGEALCYTYVHTYKVNVRIVRIFNTYGPHMEENDGRVVSNFITQAIRNIPITVHGDGKQTRSFCYVSDMVSGIIKAMEDESTRGEIINLGNPDERTVLEIAKLIRKLSGSSSKITYVAERNEDIARRKPDITKAKQLLHWKPTVMLEHGLVKTIEYFKKLTNS